MARNGSTRRGPMAVALALVVAICALGPAAVAATPLQAACPAGLTPDQCKICALSATPAACHACVQGAKASKEPEAPAANAATCMVCGSLASKDQRDMCTGCVKTQGFAAGCSACAGAALYGIPENSKPTAQGLATAGGCYSCYAKAGKDLQATPACAACWAPASKDPAACSTCVAGATGVPAIARAGCFGCYLKTQADAAGCNACLKAATAPANAQVCPLCAKPGAATGEQGQCYSCMSSVKASLPGVRWLCHFTGTAEGNKPVAALTAAVPKYFKCLSGAGTLDAGQACRKCMDKLEAAGAAAGDQCFAALA